MKNEIEEIPFFTKKYNKEICRIQAIQYLTNNKISIMNNIVLDKDDLPKLKKLYKESIENDKQIIIYKNNQIAIDYLQYLIEYLELKLT